MLRLRRPLVFGCRDEISVLALRGEGASPCGSDDVIFALVEGCGTSAGIGVVDMGVLRDGRGGI